MKPFFYSFEKYPFHVSGKCPHGQWPDVTMDQAWKIFLSNLDLFYRLNHVKTHSFVLMKNHYHWICSLRKPSSVKAAEPIFDAFHQSVSFDFQLFKPKKDSSAPLDAGPKIILLDHIEAYRNTYLYIYRNPLEASLVKNVLDYKYSTLPYVLGLRSKPLGFPIHDNMQLIQNPYYVLQNIQREPNASRETD